MLQFINCGNHELIPYLGFNSKWLRILFNSCIAAVLLCSSLMLYLVLVESP